MLVFALVFTFSISAFANGATVTVCEDGSRVIETPADPVPNVNAEENGNGRGPHNPIYVAGD